MAQIIDGKAIARQLDEKTKAEVDALVAAGGPRPGRNDLCPCGSGVKYKKCCFPAFG